MKYSLNFLLQIANIAFFILIIWILLFIIFQLSYVSKKIKAIESKLEENQTKSKLK